MKKLIFIAAICALLGVTVFADLLQIGYEGSPYGQYQTGQGGEFTVLSIGWSPLAYYEDNVKNIGVAGTFQTFCLESLETINGFPSIYEVVLSDAAVYGSNYPDNDPLSIGTAYLYHQFQSEALVGYLPRTSTEIAELQNAIWYLEGEGGSLSQNYIDLLVSKFGSVDDAMNTNANGAYGVKVMNLWDVGYVGVPGHQHQDLLVRVPVPGAILLGILGLGVAGLKLRKFT